MERYVLRMTRWALSASLAVPCVIWPLWLDFWEQSGKRQAWQGLEAFVEDWPGSGEDQAKEAWWCWERRLHSQMSVGHQRAGRLGVGTLATAGVGSHRSIQLPPSSRSLRPSRNGSPVVPRPPDCLFSRESGSWFLWALLWLLNIGSKNFLNTTWSYKTCLKTGFPPFPPPHTHTLLFTNLQFKKMLKNMDFGYRETWLCCYLGKDPWHQQVCFFICKMGTKIEPTS